MKKYGQYTHVMKLLNLEKSWELLLNKAFVDGKCPQELESTGRQILEKCNGLPLAIKVVGSLLVGKQSKSEWEQVLHQINSNLESVDSNVSAILELSYQNLSPKLKSCFLCLAFFKEDAVISAERLVNIWVGLGLIRQEGRTRVEEIGRGYLEELINRNVVQIRELTIDDGVKNCQLHDLVRDICLRKAREEIGFVTVKGEERTTTSTSTESLTKKPRHCVVYDGKSESFSLEHNKHLRSLSLENVDLSTHESRDWKSFQLIKILVLNGFNMGKLPRCFRTLIGLKYLIIHDGSLLRLRFPRWLDNLKKLEVIDIGCRRVLFPISCQLKMESLRYIKANIIGGMNNIQNWKNLETLKDIWVDDWMRCSSEVKATCHIRELGIRLYSQRDSDELSRIRESLEKMEKLVSLCLIFSTHSPVDAALCMPHLGSRLTKLKLKGAMMKFPDASMFPPNLSHLTLSCSKLNEDPMPELGKLSNLSYLKLQSDVYEGKRMKVLHDGFPCLKVLTLKKMFKVRCIDIEEGGIPHLVHLRIRSCRELETKSLPKHTIISIL